MAKKKIEDLQQYWQEIAAKNGVPEEITQAIGESLGNEAVSKAFRQAFVATPDHHSTVDTVKAEAEARVKEWEKWYDDVALPAYKTNLSGIERLKQYENRFGDLDGNNGNNYSYDQPGVTEEKLMKIIDDRLRPLQSGVIGLTKSLPTMMLDYYDRFKEKLDVNEIQKISESEGLTPDMAYQKYIQPKIEEQRQTEFEMKIKEAEERGARKALSNHNLPVGDTPREPSVFFDREEYTPEKTPTPLQAERLSHEAFAEGWNTPEGDTGKQ